MDNNCNLYLTSMENPSTLKDIARLSELITHLRILTLGVIESILKWRESLIAPYLLN